MHLPYNACMQHHTPRPLDVFYEQPPKWNNRFFSLTLKFYFINLLEGILVSIKPNQDSKRATLSFTTSLNIWMRWIEMKLEWTAVLIVDGYLGHHSFKLFNWCHGNEVILIILYPNSTHILQVCDAAMFSTMKAKYVELHQQCVIDNPEKFFNEIELVKILKLSRNDRSSTAGVQ